MTVAYAKTLRVIARDRIRYSVLFLFLFMAAGTCSAWSADEDPHSIVSPYFVLDARTPPPLGALEQQGHIVMGKENAPIKLVYFTGIDCVACREGWQNTRPRLELLADKGIIRLYFVTNAYFSIPGWYANIYLLCTPANDRYKILNTLINDTGKWARSVDTTMDYLEKLTESLRLNWPQTRVCLNDETKQQQARSARDQAFIYYGLTQIPVYSIWNSPYRFSHDMDADLLEKTLYALAEQVNRK